MLICCKKCQDAYPYIYNDVDFEMLWGQSPSKTDMGINASKHGLI